jgi:hypothetical protein
VGIKKNRLIKMPKPLSSILTDNVWAGERCFVVGGGPSLIGFNWELLRDTGRVIAVNRAIEDVPWADIMFSLDNRLYNWLHSQRDSLNPKTLQAYDHFAGMKVWLDSAAYPFGDDIYTVPFLGHVGVSFSLKEGLYSGGNSGSAALGLAVALGCSPIVLLGFDMGHASNGATHYHDGYPQESCDPQSRTWIETLNKIAPKIKVAGIQVINANPQSNVRCFPFGEIMHRRQPDRPFVICSFYTLDYAESAMRLRASLDRFGLEYRLQKIEHKTRDYADWQKRTFFKADFVKNMLEQYPDKDIIWMDADSEVMQYPELFGNIPGNLAARIYQGRKLVSSTVYFKNCPEIKGIVDEWIELNAKPREKFECQREQMNLQEVIERADGKVKFVNLPKEYGHIFDDVDKCEKPVIVQWQASRKFREVKCTI